MVYFDDLNDDEDQAPAGQTNGSSQSNIIESGGTAAPSSNTGGGTADAGGAPKSQTRGWTNLVDYVTANKGQDATMGAKVKGTFDNQVAGLNNQSQNFNNTVGQQVAQNTINDTTSKAVAKSPTAVNKADFQKQYNAQWAGPSAASDVSGYSDIGTGYNTTKDNSQKLSDFDGRQAILSDVYAEPKYSTGEKRLDSFILGAGEGGQQSIKDTQDETANAATGWQGLVDNLNNSINSGKKTTTDTAANVRSAYDTKLGGLNQTFNSLQTQMKNDSAQSGKNFATLEKNLASDDANQRQQAYKAVGLDPSSGEFLRSQGFDMTRLTDPVVARQLGDYAKKSDVNDYLALRGLLDQKSAFDGLTSKTGGTGYFNTNSNLLQAGQQLTGLNKTVNDRLAAENAQRASDYAGVQQALSGGSMAGDEILNSLGLDDFDKRDLQYAVNMGIDPLQFLTKGGNLTTGDVLKGNESAQWSNLMKALGINSNLAAASGNTAAPAYKFDLDGFRKAMLAPGMTNGGDGSGIQDPHNMNPVDSLDKYLPNGDPISKEGGGKPVSDEYERQKKAVTETTLKPVSKISSGIKKKIKF